MTKTIHGTVHGRTIELHEDVGLSDGTAVEVQVKLMSGRQEWGDGILRSAGCMTDDAEFDAAMQQIYQDRKLERRESAELC